MKDLSMEEVMNMDSFAMPKVNDVVTGVVVAINGDEVTVDIGGATEGTIYLNELSSGKLDSVHDVVKIGDNFTGLVKKVSDEQILLSRKALEERAKFEEVKKAFAEGTVLEATVMRAIRGGLLVNVNGVEAFLPASLVDVRYVEDLNVYVGQKFNVKIEGIKRDRVSVTRKELVAAERDAAKKEQMETLAVGNVVDAKVVRIANFGAFVAFGAVEGLVHLSEISHLRFKEIADVLAVGDKVKAEVVKIDGEKVGLSIKKATPSPFETYITEHQVGEAVTGTVMSIHDYGAFVKVAEGVEGLVHSSELSWEQNRSKVSDFLSEGKKVKVKIVEINSESGRLGLSVKQLENDPWSELSFNVGDVVSGNVVSVTEIGAFINVATHIDGLCHFSEASWSASERLENLVAVGDSVSVKVISIDRNRKRLGLSLRQVSNNPWLDVSVKRGEVVTGTVDSIDSRGAYVKVADNVVGFLPIGQITDRRLGRVEEALSIGEEISVMVTNFEPNNFKLELSVRKIAEEAERKDFNDYMKDQNAEEVGVSDTIGDLFGDSLKDFL